MNDTDKYSKKNIILNFIIILMVGLPVFGLLVYLSHPEQKDIVLSQITPFSGLIVGMGISLLVDTKTRKVKIISFFVGLGALIFICWFFNLIDMVKTIAFYSGGYVGINRLFMKNFGKPKT